MDVVTIVVGSIVLVIGLLVARGVWLIGRGSEAEQAARAATSKNSVGSSGWMLLDGLQKGDIPIVSTIEDRLGINQDEEDEKA